MRAARPGAFAAGVLAVCAPAYAEPPLCRATLEVVPERPWVGEEVIWTLRIERRRDVVGYDWAEAPVFPELRAEWLPGRAEADQREAILVSEERRALFAAAAGRLSLPRASLRCESPERIEVVEVPARALRVRALPAHGRPPGFSGLVGDVRVSASLTPERVALGESARLAVVVQGEVAAWDAQVAAPELGDAADVFPLPPELARDSGRRLALRRHFAWDLAPRRTGALALPEFRVAYFDPASERYRVASVRPPALQVDPPAPRPPERPAAQRSEPEAPGGLASRWPLAAAAAAALAVAAALVARARRAAAPRDPRDFVASASQHLGDAALALERGDVEPARRSLSRALREALAPLVPDARSLTAQELQRAAGEGGAELAALAVENEAARYRASSAPEREREDVARLLAAARRALRYPGV